MPYSSLVFSRSVQTRQWWMSFSPSYTPRTVWVLPTSMTRSIPPSPLEFHDFAAGKLLRHPRPFAPEDEEAGVVHAHRGPGHVLAAQADDDALSVQKRAPPPLGQNPPDPFREEEPVDVREGIEETREDIHPRKAAPRLDPERRRLSPQPGRKIRAVRV